MRHAIPFRFLPLRLPGILERAVTSRFRGAFSLRFGPLLSPIRCTNDTGVDLTRQI
jgi:hypothetical protein